MRVPIRCLVLRSAPHGAHAVFPTDGGERESGKFVRHIGGTEEVHDTANLQGVLPVERRSGGEVRLSSDPHREVPARRVPDDRYVGKIEVPLRHKGALVVDRAPDVEIQAGYPPPG